MFPFKQLIYRYRASGFGDRKRGIPKVRTPSCGAQGTLPRTALTYTATGGTAKKPFMTRAAQRSCEHSALAATKMRFSLNDSGESDAGTWRVKRMTSISEVFLASSTET